MGLVVEIADVVVVGRRALRQADPTMKGIVADTANARGFWHMGQFAADYRRMFGKLPSETLARGR